MFDHKVTEHLPQFSFIFLASAKDRPWLTKDLREGGGWGAACCWSCCCSCWLTGVLTTMEMCKWHFQIQVASSCCLASPWRMGNLLQVRIRWHTFVFDRGVFRTQSDLNVSTAFLLVCFLSLKESTWETRRNAFYFFSKALFILEKIKF